MTKSRNCPGRLPFPEGAESVYISPELQVHLGIEQAVARTKDELRSLKPHPARLYLPPLSSADLELLRESLRVSGPQYPILACGPFVVDGWSRLQVCLELGLRPKVTRLQLQDKDVGRLVLSLNLARRTLSKSQRAMIGAELVRDQFTLEGLKIKHQNLRRQQAPAKPLGRSVVRAARFTGAGKTYVWAAHGLLTSSPELAAKVKAGRIELAPALRIHRQEMAFQRACRQAKEKPADRAHVEIFCGPFQKRLDFIRKGSAQCILTDPLYTRDALPEVEAMGDFANRKLAPGGTLLMMTGHATMLEMGAAVLRGGKDLRHHYTITLVLNGPTGSHPARGFVARTRLILVFFRCAEGIDKPIRNKFPRDIYDVRGIDRSAHEYGQKPEAFFPLLEWYTRPGDLVVEPFAGGGSIVAACAALGRRCAAAEINPITFSRLHARLFGTIPSTGHGTPHCTQEASIC